MVTVYPLQLQPPHPSSKRKEVSLNQPFFKGAALESLPQQNNLYPISQTWLTVPSVSKESWHDFIPDNWDSSYRKGRMNIRETTGTLFPMYALLSSISVPQKNSCCSLHL